MSALLKGEPTKDDFIYARIEKDLIQKVDILTESKGFKNRSQAIRCILSWSFDSGLILVDKPEKRKRKSRNTVDLGMDDVIYTRIENKLLTKIDLVKESCKLDTRSQTVREIIAWAFQNGIEQA